MLQQSFTRDAISILLNQTLIYCNSLLFTITEWNASNFLKWYQLDNITSNISLSSLRKKSYIYIYSINTVLHSKVNIFYP